LFLIVLSIPLISHQMMSEAHAVGTSITTNPSSVANLSLTSGTVTFKINLANSPAINEFYVSLLYNHTVLQPSTISFNGNILGSSGNILVECIDGRLVGGSLSHCQSWDVLGVTSFGMYIFGGVITPPATGLLFQITFNIAARGFSQIHFLHAFLSNGASPVPVGTSDGYFTNADCPAGSGVLCKPTVPSFTFSPSAPTTRQTVTFNASRSMTPNRGATIRTFFWDFGDESGPTTNPRDPANPVIQHTYLSPDNFTAMLSVTDSYGVTASASLIVQVIERRDFTIFLAPPVVGDLLGGTSTTASLTLKSMFGFSGLVNLTAIVLSNPYSTNLPVAKLAESSLMLSPGGSNTTNAEILTATSTSAGEYTIEVIGTSGSLSHESNFQFSVFQRSLLILCGDVVPFVPVGQRVSELCNVAALAFNGTATLSAKVDSQVDTGVSVSISPDKIDLLSQREGQGFAILTITTSASTPPNFYNVVVVGNSGNLTAKSTVRVEVEVISEVIAPPVASPILSQLRWEHHVSISRDSGSQSFVVGFFNPNNVTMYLVSYIFGVDRTGSQAFFLFPTGHILLPGQRITVEVQASFSNSVGATFMFVAYSEWGLSTGNIRFTSSLTLPGVQGSGTFSVGR
jgi:PKD domain-containing protein